MVLEWMQRISYNGFNTSKNHRDQLISSENMALCDLATVCSNFFLLWHTKVCSFSNIAQIFAKYNVLAEFNPARVDTSIYDVSANAVCIAIRKSAEFALRTVSDAEYMEFLAMCVRSNRRPSQKGKAQKISVLATLSRGQNRAQSILRESICSSFYLFCPMNCILRSQSASTDEKVLSCSLSMLLWNYHKKDASFYAAWLMACR